MSEHLVAHDDAGDVTGKDLGDLVPDWLMNHSDFFHSRHYARWECNVGEPHLVSCGYTVSRWRWCSTHKDGFGPFLRAVDVEKDGDRATYFYG